MIGTTPIEPFIMCPETSPPKDFIAYLLACKVIRLFQAIDSPLSGHKLSTDAPFLCLTDPCLTDLTRYLFTYSYAASMSQTNSCAAIFYAPSLVTFSVVASPHHTAHCVLGELRYYLGLSIVL